MIQRFANPGKFLALANAILPWLWGLTLALFAIGLYLALVRSPADYQQGETVRIMYVHVPAVLDGADGLYDHGIASAVSDHLPSSACRCRGQDRRADRCRLLLPSPRPPDHCGASPCGAPGGSGMRDSPRCSCSSCSISAISPCGRRSMIRIAPQRSPASWALAGFVNVPIIKFSVDWWNSLASRRASFASAGRPSIRPCWRHCSSWVSPT